jgi:alpha-1,3-rhamnosyl/mannosyltransferase
MKVILATDAVKTPLTGIGRYVYELATHLGQLPSVESLRFFRGFRFESELPKPGAAPPAQSRLRRRLLKSRAAAETYRVISPFLKKRILAGNEDSIFHGPNFYLPPFEGKRVATFHDLSIFNWSQCHPVERVRYMRKELEMAVKRADMLVTDSEFCRKEIASFFSFPLEKIRAVPLACSEAFHPRDFSELQPVLDRLGLKADGYCLFVGTIEPRKNVDALIDAYSRLPESLRQKWPLVLVGYRGWSSERLHERIQAAEQKGWLRYLDYIDNDTLPCIYAGARLFTFPSLYEGFGLPVLEAMASGVPVVCSNASSLPEVAGGAAAMCDPQDIEALTRLIADGLEDDDRRATFRSLGISRAADFSWHRCAEDTVSVYRDVLSCPTGVPV